MRIVVFGAGGLGSVIGGYLAEAGAEVTLVARPAHAEAVQKEGLLIRGVRGEHRVNLRAVSCADQTEGEFDWFFLGVKAKDTAQALKEALPLRGRVKAALSLQNSIVKDEELSRFFGLEHTVGFAIIEGARMAEPGVVENTLTVPVTAYIGELNGKLSQRVQTLAEIFNEVDLGTKAVTNIRQVEWEKLAQICLASSYAVSTLSGYSELRFPDGLLVREGSEHFVALAKEILRVYKALGYVPENYFAPVSRLKELEALSFEEGCELALRMGQALKGRESRATTSMHEDVLRGRKTEVDFILGPFVEEAERLGVTAPTLRTAYRIIKTLDHYLK